MESDVLKVVGQVAGIGGLALGVFLILYRDIVRKNIFPKLPADEAYRLLKLIAIAVWSVAVIGIGAWIYKDLPHGSATAGDCGIASVGESKGNAVNCSGVQASPAAKP